MIKAVIFDMFETLVSLFEGSTYFSEDIAADLGVEHDPFRKAWHETEEARTLGKVTIEEGIGEALKAMGIYSEKNVAMVADGRKATLEDTFRVIPKESLDLLHALRAKGILTGLISNCYSDEARMIKNCSLYPLLDAAMLSYEQGVAKPEPEIYLRAAAELGVKPEECLYVGDGGSRELFTAKEIGMHPVQALWYRHMMFEPHVPSPVFDEFPHAESRKDIEEMLEETV
ncbi:HAD family hydrolase [Butyrivibrio sp. XB500-5]|uniref:HAD family hydrolase n=1 Tax=Butyrivibrio sp. XB500-5 TaxID=2364880 RepID=UPI000EA9562D|nr:HAD-IA family hydrolase [Butyrivibrio sp. XB500-5]RKM58631.1 HAD family hydrolase [Butyrivibrio sp. XB500-5]